MATNSQRRHSSIPMLKSGPKIFLLGDLLMVTFSFLKYLFLESKNGGERYAEGEREREF